MNATVLSFVRSFFAPVRMGAALGSLLLLAACGSGGETSAQTSESEPEGQYGVGEPLSDPALAVVVRSHLGADTLFTESFEEEALAVAMQYNILDNAEEMRSLRTSIVERFVLLEHLILGEADSLDLLASEADVEQRMQQIMTQFPSVEELRQALAADNLTEEGLREQLAYEITQQALITHFSEAAEEPDAEAIEAYIEERAEEVRASHILFIPPPGATEAQHDSTRSRAEAVLDSVRAGADFRQMALLHSQGPSGPGGGDLGFFARGDMVAPFAEAAFALSDSGSVTKEPVKTDFGYHLIQLTGRQAATPMIPSEARQRILQQRQRDAVQEGINRLRASATVHINPDVADVDLNATVE